MSVASPFLSTTAPHALVAALNLLSARGIRVFDVGLRRPTLDDVFLTLTGAPG